MTAPFAAMTLRLAALATLGLTLAGASPAPQAEEPPAAAPQPASPTTALAAAGGGPDSVYQVRLEASWDDATKRITGTEHLRWHNTSAVPIDELCFHLYLNAFANNRSTFMRESGGQLRRDRFRGDRWGWIEVSSLRLADGTDLASQGRFVAPDDGNPFDRTVARYPLPEPLAPGGWITLDIEFTSQLPEIFARTGAHGDYILAGQWFPKIAVFEAAGVRGRTTPGWNCHQFHAWSEFYSDFGDYDVTLDLPARYRGKIGAAGRLIDEKQEGDRVRARFVQRGIGDFAWTADPRFEVIHDRFDPQRDVPAGLSDRIAAELGRPAGELALSPVELTLLIDPSHRSLAPRYLAAAKAAISGLGLRLGAYPYPTLTLVDPPLGAGGSGGMEYPTFITLGASTLSPIPPFRGILLPETVTVHEFGHQYWYGMVASNEFEESWLDEGINSYYEMVVMDETYGHPLRFLGIEATQEETDRAALGHGRYTDPIVRPAWDFLDVRSYALNSYMRPAITLDELRHLLGREVFARAMRRFFQRYRWHHPSTADFERTINEEAGRDLGWFFRQALHSTRTLDYAVRSATSRPEPAERGVFWENGQRVTRGKDEGSGTPTTPERYISTVVVERRGEFRQPVTVEIRFEDGRSLRRFWQGDRRWIRWTFTTGSRLASAEVDPDHLLSLDVDRLNNGRRLDADRRPAAKLLADLLFWLQSLFGSGWLLA